MVESARDSIEVLEAYWGVTSEQVRDFTSPYPCDVLPPWVVYRWMALLAVLENEENDG